MARLKGAPRKSRGMARAANNAAVRTARDLRLIDPTDWCACIGATIGEVSYAVKPAICGHWFYILHSVDDGFYLDHTRIRTNPIQDLARGTRVRIKATVGLSFKKGTAHALKYAHWNGGVPFGTEID